MTLAEHDDVALPGGAFLMGDAFSEGYPFDGEGPVHEVRVSAFTIDRYPVTNVQFAEFVTATGYRSEAEQYGDSAVFAPFSTAAPNDVLGRSPSAPWWISVRGADWAHPSGSTSNLDRLEAHPVVHVTHNDAVAYCAWAGRRLPTEAEWEYAARGGLAQARFPWGDELLGDGGEHRCNIWQGDFPRANSAEDGYTGTSPIGTYEANGYGLFDMAGNVWEWCADWYSPDYYQVAPPVNPTGPTSGSRRVMRGGSHLCHDSYCNRYRVAARTSNTPDSSAGNCGFRTIHVGR